MKLNDLNKILKDYDLTNEDINYIVNTIGYIFIHPEFQKRCTDEYPHHGKMTLGEHILEDVILTYKLSLFIKNKNYHKDLALKIAMFHDLYTEPWQNNEHAKNKKFCNKHGFSHPIEAVINAYIWFKDDFKNEDNARVIIDSVIHHMFPLPVVIIDNKNNNSRELNNFELFKNLPANIQEIICESTNRCKFLNLSWSHSKYLEGKIVSKADKKSSLREFNNINGVIALITGHNKTLRK